MRYFVLTLFSLVVGIAIGAVAGHFHGVAVTLQSVMAGQSVPVMSLEDLK